MYFFPVCINWVLNQSHNSFWLPKANLLLRFQFLSRTKFETPISEAPIPVKYIGFWNHLLRLCALCNGIPIIIIFLKRYRSCNTDSAPLKIFLNLYPCILKQLHIKVWNIQGWWYTTLLSAFYNCLMFY